MKMKRGMDPLVRQFKALKLGYLNFENIMKERLAKLEDSLTQERREKAEMENILKERLDKLEESRMQENREKAEMEDIQYCM